MNKINILIYIFTLWLVCLLFAITLLLFWSSSDILYFDGLCPDFILNHATHKELDLSNTMRSYNNYTVNSETSSYFNDNSSFNENRPLFDNKPLHEETQTTSIYNKCKNTTSKLYLELKYKTKLIEHKIKLFDRTLSWFFKGSRPGGGRGL
jgi:hypothetical protein